VGLSLGRENSTPHRFGGLLLKGYLGQE